MRNLSIKTKIFLTFVLIIMAGYGFIYLYILNYEKKILLEKEMRSLQSEMSSDTKELFKYIEFLKKESSFMASLEVMEDIVINDIDRRIATILRKKAKDLGEEIIFVARDAAGKTVAASIEGLEVKLPSVTGETQTLREYLFINYPIKMGPQNRTVGYLTTIYPLKNLSYRLRNANGIYSWLTSDFIDFEPVKIPSDTIEISKKLPPPLDYITLHRAVDKSIAFSTINHVQTLMGIVFAVMVALTTLFLFFVSRNILSPLKSLYETADYIIKTGDYSKQIAVTSNDEIGRLTQIFNRLISKTDESIKSLEEKSKEYEESLIDLIEFFNTITKTDSAYATITVATRELKRLLKTPDVEFVEYPPYEADYVVPIELGKGKDSKESRGAIYIRSPQKRLKDLERFLESVSKMISLQIERIELTKKLEETLKAKSSFLSSMSHELKTPIGSILSLSQYLMSNSSLGESEIETIAKIERSADHLLKIIEDILTIAKADSGTIEVEFGKHEIKTLTEEVLDILNPVAEAKGLKIYNRVEKDIFLNTDPKLFKMVLINLISNAIKFTPKGDIKIYSEKTAQTLSLIVTDEGIGMDKEDVKNVFEEFFQGRNRKEGIGLGLSIAKKFAALLNGELSLHSEGIGKGTKAIFKIKLS